MKLSAMIATLGGVGHIQPASGTWGSLAALPLAWVLHVLGGPALLALGIALFYGLGHWATAQETRGQADHDPSEIVVDELVGQWIAFFPVSFGASYAGADLTALWPGWIVAFGAFRAFDILKPGPVGWADRKHGPTGVMLDDVIAGVLAALVVVALAALFHIFLM
ncbi:phosphatidylglycerophosphatase A [Pseudooceanicola aestuarii]|uniref:phosphatidylglycerophosphatase A family protein n=1 Tax=Pseudooceanicola aestuarii TaxID=2697319 RepID=UPI0013D8AC0C|nr:phosphatidylglycerophosphatase A [Pseudooceanicola aestuarii]